MIFNIFKRDIFNYRSGLSYVVRSVNGAFSFFIRIPTKKKKTVHLLILLALLFTSQSRSQIYNYDPIRHTNFETNPAYLAGEKYTHTLNLLHHGSFFSRNKFRCDAVQFSVYNHKIFSGLGFTLNSTYLNDSTFYNYAGISIAYRIILFNSVYTKIGLTYKIMNSTCGTGTFGYYTFSTANENWNRKTGGTNMNLSVAFTSANDYRYISGGILNYEPGSNNTAQSNNFPQYYFLNAGDLGRILEADRWDIYYTALTKKYYGQKIFPISHFLTAMFKGLSITRNSSIKYGARTGIADGNFFQFCPVLQYYNYINSKNSFTLQFFINSEFNIKTLKMPFMPKLQTNLIYKF